MDDDFFFGFMLGVGFGVVIILCMAILSGATMSSQIVDITTNVTSTSINHDGKPVLNTEVGKFIFEGESTSEDVDYMIVKLFPKCTPVILHIKDGYVRSFDEVNNNDCRKNC